jgi:tetraacyldisaccharide 4'-kinase
MEKGKIPQKKLLGEAEVLVERNARALANEVEKILFSEKRYRRMAETGRKRLGSPGALDSVIESLMKGSGWETRNRIQVKLAGYSSDRNPPEDGTPSGG